jgi:ABC-2 type transport system permease protein
MKKAIYIARNELYTLFYSPIAWILMILFLILTSADYIGLVDEFLGMFERGGINLMFLENLTSNLTSNPRFGYFFGVIRNLYIFFPLITMGLISRETSSGTIKLLYSSPVRIREIVMGKFLAMICFAGCLLVLLLFTLTGLSQSISYPDYGQMLASVFGLFLVLCTYAAIGLFISSLTSYQIVAAIITLGVFALLSKIGELWQDIDSIRSVTYYMNIGEKSYNFILGLMNLRDFTYFVLIISSFLLFTIIKIKSATESISRFKKAMRYITVIGVAFLIGYITNKPQVNVYYDATRGKVHTITPPTQAMLAKLKDGELEITAFSNLLDRSFWTFTPESQNRIITDLWEPYIRFKPDIHIHFVYYYNNDTSSYYFKANPGKSLREIAEKEAKTWKLSLDRFLNADQVNKLVNTNAEEFRSFFMLTYKGKKAIVRTFDDNRFWPDENNIAAGINRLIADPPKISFLSDEIERGPFSERTRDYKSIASRVGKRYALINQGYDFDTVSLKQAPVPEGIAALVIADPRTPISDYNMGKINNFIKAGGNLLVTTEPDRKEVTKPLLDMLGISLRNGLLIQPSVKYSSDLVFSYLTDTAKNLSPQFSRQLKDDLRYYADSQFRVAMAGASVIDVSGKDGFRVSPLLVTDKVLSWNRLAPISNDSLQLKVAKVPTDEPGSFVTAVRMNRTINGKDQRIIVASDADFLTDPQFGGSKPRRYNYDFGFWCFSYFAYGKFPANTLRPESLDNSFKIGQGNVGVQKWIFYWIVPALIAVLCSVIIIRRKRK